MNLLNFHYALTLAEMLYGTTVREDLGEEILLTGWNLIGNKRMQIYRYKVCIDECEKGVELPCNCDIIEAVTTNFEDWDYVTNDTPNGNIYTAFVEHYIENRKAFRNPLYAKGKFINYERVGNTLYFDRPHGEINILYRGLILDEDGLPLITDSEAMALATYLTYIIKYKEGIQTNNPTLILMAENLRLKWLTLVDLARADYYMSLNEWNLVLDARSSWTRKQYNRSYKMYH